ncbi:MAG: hypothetical protein Q8O13_08345 [Candidatus Omnitrophota bacterium]|nr:hypothetical protein [Candidatus Omnitrophota bacterium]
MRKVRNLILIIFILGIFLLVFWVIASFRIYQSFNKEELFATVSCQRSKEPSFDYIIFYKPINLKEPIAFGIKGNQWRIEGVVIKWKGFVNILGIHTWHKPVRLSGRYSDKLLAKSFSFTEYALNGGEDNFWKFVFGLDKFLPFIEAIYGSGTFIPCRENSVYKVYVTTSGYMIKSNNWQTK